MLVATNISALTHYCKATADQLRLQILRILSRESFGVLEICHIVAAAQPAVSHHLKILNAAGLTETKRQGTSIYYRRAFVSNDDPIKQLRASLFDSIDQVPLDVEISQRTQEVYDARHRAAQEFFAKNAHRLKENQDLIAEYKHYDTCLTSLIDTYDADSKVIEIGPGESDLLIGLASHFNQVVAIDNTTEMLARTEAKLVTESVANVRLIKAELHELPLQPTFNLVVLNMVLHHLASPAKLFQDAYRYLALGGHLLIAELCFHDQAWTKDVCGDLWLGFEPEELDKWAIQANLSIGQSAYLGLNNGFQVQVRTFEKTTSQVS